MSTCSVLGCDCPANSKALDWRRRRGNAQPAVKLLCDFHAQKMSHTPGISIRGLTRKAAGGRGSERIDLRAALRRLGKLPGSNEGE